MPQKKKKFSEFSKKFKEWVNKIQTSLKSFESRIGSKIRPMTFWSMPNSTIKSTAKSKLLWIPLTQILWIAQTKLIISFMNLKEHSLDPFWKCAAFGKPVRKDRMFSWKWLKAKNQEKRKNKIRRFQKKPVK